MLASARHILTILLLVGLVGCSADSERASDQGQDWTAPGDLDDSDGRCTIRPDADSDGDGLLDIFEDLNRNCLVDPGETDPFDPDSDGDGLFDGDEDADGNGVWDEARGELNPRVSDTDGNGVLDGDEPKARVCNRAHAVAALAERRVLSPDAAMYLHPLIQRAEPFSFSGAVFLQGTAPNEGGLLFETSRQDRKMEAVLSRLHASLERTTENAAIHLIGERDVEPYGHALAHLSTESVTFSFQTLLENLSDIAPELTTAMALHDNYRVTATNLSFQLLGVVHDERVRWALAWKETRRSSLWFSVVHPRLIAERPSDTIRFVCENVESLQRPELDILLVIEDGPDAAIQVLPWLEAVDYVVAMRRESDLESRIFFLRASATDQLTWHQLEGDGPLAGRSNIEFVHFVRSLDETVVTAANVPPAPASNAPRELALMVFSGGGDPGEVQKTKADLPELSGELLNANFVVVSPADEPYDCPWRMTEARSAAVHRLVAWSNAYHLSGCGLPPTEEASQRILAPLIGWAWVGTERDAIWGTVFLADGDRSVPAEITMIGGQRALVASEAVHAAPSAASFAAWFPASVVAERPSVD